MPIVIDRDIPAFKILTGERCFVMDKQRAHSQEIRPIEIAILNLMPTKETTETQFMRLLSNSPLQVNITLIKTATYRGTHVAEEHLERFYKNFEDIKDKLSIDAKTLMQTLTKMEIKGLVKKLAGNMYEKRK